MANSRSRVDLVVALCHSGISRLASTPGEENAAQDLARLDGVDALFLGHQHLLFPGEDFADFPGVDAERGTIHGKPAVMAGFCGQPSRNHRSRAGEWTRLAGRRRAGRGPADRQTRRERRRDRAGRVGRLRARSGQGRARRHAALHPHAGRQAREPLHTYLALIADDPTVQLVNEAQRAYAAPLAAARADLASLPILSAAAPFKCGGRSGPDSYTDIAAGPIAIKDVADIYPYPNTS